MRWVLDADIQGCFDNFDHGILRELLTRGIKDKNIMRLINQWLRAGIVDGKSMQHDTKSTPRGNIISPLMCNVYMHYVLDRWMDKTIRPLLKGESFIIRYADDCAPRGCTKDESMASRDRCTGIDSKPP